jgi:uncharacterized protein (TIGR01319 family)
MPPSPGCALLVDFGSTYTKLRAIDLDTCRLVGSAQGSSTVTTDITIGLNAALAELDGKMGGLPAFRYRLATSSAAGGLRMVTIGLVPELTAEAARFAALGAGAKVVGIFSYGLNEHDRACIESLQPDVLLLAGGTDGGNRDVIVRNAAVLASSRLECPIIVAGNRMATDDVCWILRDGGKTAVPAANVMPTFGVIEIESAQAVVRNVFIEQIVHAKGLDRVSSMLDGVLMPTPVAVLQAARMLAEGVGETPGLGELMVVDPGGATTDIHTICEGAPTHLRVIRKGLPEPYMKRTVEGDLGLRHNALSILEAGGAAGLAKATGLSVERVSALVEALSRDVDSLPKTAEDAALDAALARVAIDIAVERHAGRIEIAYGPDGPFTLQYGKDLSAIRTIIGTGGVLAYGLAPGDILAAVLAGEERSTSLRPRSATLMLDRDYLLFACGLLAEVAPDVALRVGLSHLTRVGFSPSELPLQAGMPPARLSEAPTSISGAQL